jgi:hypothetical protein
MMIKEAEGNFFNRIIVLKWDPQKKTGEYHRCREEL